MIEIQNHAELARSRVLKQYAEEQRIVGVISLLADAVQQVETALFGFAAKTNLGTADGGWLNTIGAIVGETRDGLDDAQYRKNIRARILANASSGSVEEILSVIYTVYGHTGLSITIQEAPPAAVLIKIQDAMDLGFEKILLKLLRCTRAAGVALLLRYQFNTVFELSATGSVEPGDTDTGLSDLSQSIGGSLTGEERA